MTIKILGRVPVRFKDSGEIKWRTINHTPVPMGENGDLKGEVGNKIERESKDKPDEKPKDRGGRKPKSKQEPKIFPKSGVNLIEQPPSKDTDSYLKRFPDNPSKAVTAYYDEQLRGGVVKTTVDMNGKEVPAEAVFEGHGRREFRKFRGNQRDILAVLPYVPGVINEGRYSGRDKKRNHGDQVAFHTKMQRVPINGRKRLVAVDIGESEAGKLYAYNVNTEGVPSFENKKRIFERNYVRRKGKNKIGDAVLLPSSKDSVVNLHRAQHLLRSVADSLPNEQSPIKLYVLDVRVL